MAKRQDKILVWGKRWPLLGSEWYQIDCHSFCHFLQKIGSINLIKKIHFEPLTLKVSVKTNQKLHNLFYYFSTLILAQAHLVSPFNASTTLWQKSKLQNLVVINSLSPYLILNNGTPAYFVKTDKTIQFICSKTPAKLTNQYLKAFF